MIGWETSGGLAAAGAVESCAEIEPSSSEEGARLTLRKR